MMFIEVPVIMRETQDANLAEMGIDVSGSEHEGMIMINIINIDHFYESGEGETEVWQNGVSVCVRKSYEEFKKMIEEYL